MRRSRYGPLSRLLPVGNNLLYESPLGVMMRQEFGLVFFRIGKSLFQYVGNLLMVLLPRALKERLIRRVLN
jgi:hypothetical protein